MHHEIAEIYHVLTGSGILITRGTIEGETELPPEDPDVRNLIGPSTVGKVITGGTRQRVGPGDVRATRLFEFPTVTRSPNSL